MRNPAGTGPRTADNRPLPLASLADLRQTSYRLLSQAFLYPDGARVAALVETAAELAAAGDSLSRFAFFGQWKPLLMRLMGLDRSDETVMQRRYVSLFSVNVTGVPCPPYESVYREAGGRPTGWLTSLVEREYAIAGLSPSQGLGELPDHVAMEMEFMAVLCGREREACRRMHLGENEKALRAQKSFLDHHLTVWLPEFSRALAAADAGGVYAALGEAASVFVAHDRDLVSALLESGAGAGDVGGGEAT